MKQRLLLSFIAETENIGAYEFQGRKVRINESENIIYNSDEYSAEVLKQKENTLIFHLTYIKGKSQYKIITPENDLDSIKKDILIAIPGGIIGYHAVYMIFENIIRNSAKYGFGSQKQDKPSNLEIFIEVEEFENKDFVELRIWDNVSENIVGEKVLDQEMNKRFLEPFINLKTGEMNNSNLGLAEMRIAAGFLNIKKRITIGGLKPDGEILYRKLSEAEIAATKREYRGFICAYAKKFKGKEYLAYKLPIPKPKNVRLLGEVPETNKKFIKNSKGIIHLVKETGASQGFLDSDFVILYDNTKSAPKIINTVYKLATKKAENAEELVAVLEYLDNFPGRVVMVSDKLCELKEKNQLPDVFRKRVLTVTRKDFEKHLETKEKDIYLYLYQRWIEHLKFVRYRDEWDKYEIELIVDTQNQPSSFGHELFKKIFRDYKSIIAFTISPQGFKNSYKAIPQALEELSKDQLNEIFLLLTNVSFSKIKSKATDGGWSTEHFIETWVKGANLPLTPRQRTVIIDELNVVFRHYFVACRQFYHKYQEEVETLPKIFKANDGTYEETVFPKIDLFKTEN